MPENPLIPQRPMPANAPADTTRLDLPQALADLLVMPQVPSTTMAEGGIATGRTGLANFVGQSPQAGLPAFQQGGLVGPGGMPVPPPGPAPMAPPSGAPGLAAQGAAQQMTPQMIQAEAQRFVQQNPQQMQQIQMGIQQAMQQGDLTPQELNMMVQMATAALQNPALYPQLRRAAIQQGLATEADISPQYDPGLLFTLLLVGQALQGGVAPGLPGGAPMGGQPMPSMKMGGALPTKSPNPDGGIPIKAHEGEYVIPAEVVRAKGTEFFDSLVKKYREGQGE